MARHTADEENIMSIEEENARLKKYIVLLKHRSTNEAVSLQNEVSNLTKQLVSIQFKENELEGTNRLLRDQVESTYGQVNIRHCIIQCRLDLFDHLVSGDWAGHAPSLGYDLLDGPKKRRFFFFSGLSFSQ